MKKSAAIAKQDNKQFIIQLDEVRFASRDQIDTIFYTDKIPDSANSGKWSEAKYVIYLKKDSRYNWIAITKDDFERYVKPFVYDV